MSYSPWGRKESDMSEQVNSNIRAVCLESACSSFVRLILSHISLQSLSHFVVGLACLLNTKSC